MTGSLNSQRGLARKLGLLVAIVATLLLAGCGGSGGASSSAVAGASSLRGKHHPSAHKSRGVGDSLAPQGAPRSWLPHEDWVLEHWLPYSQQQLFSTLHVTLEQVREYFGGASYEQIPTLAALAQKHGLSVDALARELVNAWHPPSAMYPLLLNRTMRSLTQGHLMQHMLFHPFHDTALFKASPQIFGVTPHQLDEYLADGMTLAQIGQRHGRSQQQMISTAASVLRAEQAIGVQRHLTPASEAGEELALQIPLLPQWIAGGGVNPQKIYSKG